MTLTVKALLVLGAASLLGACSGESDIERFIKDPGVTPAKLSAVPGVKKFPVADYHRDTSRDPFTAKLTLTGPGPNMPGSPDMNRAKQSLEYFPLDTLRMIGFVHQDGKSYAMVQDPDKQLHRVVVGTYIGQDYGRVVAISGSGIKISESTQDNAGGWTTRISGMPFTEQNGLTNMTTAAKNADGR